MRLRFGLALAAASALAFSTAACSVPKNEVGSSAVTPASSAILTGDKALYAANAAYVGGLQLINTALDAKLLHGATAAKVNEYVHSAAAALAAARVARSTGDTLIETQQAMSALALIGQATSSIPAATTAPAS